MGWMSSQKKVWAGSLHKVRVTCVEAGVDGVDEAEVRRVGLQDRLEEIEGVQLRDVDSWKESLDFEHVADRLVGRDGCGGVEGCVGFADGGEREIEDVGDRKFLAPARRSGFSLPAMPAAI